jgi:hypothetical protein
MNASLLTRITGTAALAAVVLTGCASTPASRIERNPQVFATFAPEVQERVRRGIVAIGDTPEVVRLALGEPARVVERLDERTGASEVWLFVREAPRFSFGFGVGSSGHHSGVGLGVGTGDLAFRDDEALRVEFQQGRVVRVDYRKG